MALFFLLLFAPTVSRTAGPLSGFAAEVFPSFCCSKLVFWLNSASDLLLDVLVLALLSLLALPAVAVGILLSIFFLAFTEGPLANDLPSLLTLRSLPPEVAFTFTHLELILDGQNLETH